MWKAFVFDFSGRETENLFPVNTQPYTLGLGQSLLKTGQYRKTQLGVTVQGLKDPRAEATPSFALHELDHVSCSISPSSILACWPEVA